MKNIKVRNCRWVNLQRYDDGSDGRLAIAEGLKTIPFKIKRTFVIDRLARKGALRGMHAHRRLEQVIFCLRGSFELGLYDGTHRTRVTLKRPDQGVYMGPGVWHVMCKFKKGTILLVLASDYYQERDYLRDISGFRRFAKTLDALQ